MLRAIVTAGPTYEPLDRMRHLSNHSTGRLGIELANHLTRREVSVTLLKGQLATWSGESSARKIIPFTTGNDLGDKLKKLALEPCDAVFHAAAVSDFRFIDIRSPDRIHDGRTIGEGKIPTGDGQLVATLAPTRKILPLLRGLFPRAWIIGWKYEIEGDRDSALARAEKQLRRGETDLSVANGPAYGKGFSLLTAGNSLRHIDRRDELYRELSDRLLKRPATSDH